MADRSLPYRAAFAILALPGMVAGYFPWLIHQGQERWPLNGGAWHWVGLAIGLVGFGILASTVREFFIRGRGTLAPWDPPRALVAEGPYRWCRNPMYVGVLLLIAGEARWWGSGEVLLYGGAIGVIFHLRVVYFEEPWLEHSFPEAWIEYRGRVKRWGLI